MEIIELPIKSIFPYKNNPRHNDKAVEFVANSLRQFGWKQPIVIDEKYEIVAGHTRWKAAKMLGMETVPCVMADDLTPEQVQAYRLADNKTAEMADWDFDLLEQELNEIDPAMFDMADFGFFQNADLPDVESEEETHTTLTDKFVVPPFSILDTRQGYWQERKKIWKKKIGDNGQARDVEVLGSSLQKYNNEKYEDASILDPVLCEITCKWFLPHCGNTFDVFAGDTVFGYVSAFLGNNFTGIELRQEQCDFNQKAVNGLNANYICDDGRNVLQYIDEDSQDLLFSCPPYFDLEVYSNLKNDASNQKSYEEFYTILDIAFSNAIHCLKKDRFAVIVCGDVRDKKTGFYYNFPEDIKKTFQKNGMSLYNEMILVDVIGTARLRVNKYMESRKIAKVHQNVLVFYKGDTHNIKETFPLMEIDESEI